MYGEAQEAEAGPGVACAYVNGPDAVAKAMGNGKRRMEERRCCRVKTETSKSKKPR